jgi:putative two-component system response regulator
MDQQGIILIAEDNEVLRVAVEEMLSIGGYVVLSAENGVEALTYMKSLTPDLILSDIAMPEMDGLEFFKRVRENPDWLSIPFIFLTARGTKGEILKGKGLGAEDYLVKPVESDELLTIVHSRLARSQQLRMAQLREAYKSSLLMLANAIEARDQYTRKHVDRVMAYAVLLAKQMGWQGNRLEDLRFGAILHDIGKIHVRETTLCKNGPLNDDEWNEMRQHPVFGADMIRDISYLKSAEPAIRYHHERWDGSGYPYGLAGDKIPIMARIISVADTFDAMTTTRAYRKALPVETAYDEIVSGSGKRYDPLVVDAFLRSWETGEIQKVLASVTQPEENSPDNLPPI